MTLAGALDCKDGEKQSEQIVCECLSIKQCLDQGVNHVFRTGSHLVFLQLQTVPTAAMGVCRGVNVRGMAKNQPCPQGFGWHGDKHMGETGSLTPSKLWMVWKAAGNPARFLCWQTLGEAELMREAVAKTQAEEHSGQIPRTGWENSAQHLETTQRPKRWSSQSSVRWIDVWYFFKGAYPA